MLIRDAFFAYPGDPEVVETPIERACEVVRMQTGGDSIMAIRNLKVCGSRTTFRSSGLPQYYYVS
jgi:hypothetical protein